MHDRFILEGFSVQFIITKAYCNALVSEISQLCYKGIFRTVSLDFTDGMCTWNSKFTNVFQPIVIPVGRISLGRIYNVIGSIIDRYLVLNLSSQFSF